MSLNGTGQRLQAEISQLRRNSVRMRYGMVTHAPPNLAISLGDATEEYDNVKALGGATLNVGDRVPVLKYGNDLLVLGGVGDGAGGGGGGPFQPKDAELTTLAGMDATSASILAGMSATVQDLLSAGIPADLRAVSKDASYNPTIAVYGHSINYTGSSGGNRGLAARTASLLHTDVEMMAIAGSVLTENKSGFINGAGGWDQLGRRTRSIPATSTTAAIGLPRHGPTILFTGVNDIAKMPGTPGARTTANFDRFATAYRYAISRLLMSNLWEDDDAAITFGGTWVNVDGTHLVDTSHEIPVGQALTSSNATYSYCTATSGRTITWALPAAFPGGTAVCSFLCDAVNRAGQFDIAVDGGTAVSVDARGTSEVLATFTANRTSGSTTLTSVSSYTNISVGVWISGTGIPDDTYVTRVPDGNPGTPAAGELFMSQAATSGSATSTTILPGYWLPVIQRLEDLAPGAHSIVITPTALTTRAIFDCAWVETNETAQLVANPLQYHLDPSLDATYAPADIDTMNSVLQGVVDEFPDNVYTVETDDLIADDIDANLSDGLHPNDRGHALLAYRIADSFVSRAMTQADHAKTAHRNPYIGRNPTDNARNIIQSDVPNVTPLTIKAADYASPQSVDTFGVTGADGTSWLKVNSTGQVSGPIFGAFGTAEDGSGFGGGLEVGGSNNRVWVGWKAFGQQSPAISFGADLGVNLYRSGSDLKTDDNFIVGGDLTVSGTFTPPAATSISIDGSAGAAGSYALLITNPGGSNTARAIEMEDMGTLDSVVRVLATGDANPRFQILAGAGSTIGPIYWGDGTATPDVVLYRSAADMLKTDDSLTVGTDLTVTGTAGTGALTSTTLHATGAATLDANATITQTAAGPGLTVDGSAGNAASNAVRILTPGGSNNARAVTVAGAGGLDTVLRVEATAGDTNSAFQILGTGAHAWGDAAGGAVDTNLYRSAADILKTDDSFTVGTDLTVTGATALNDTITIANAKNIVVGTGTGTKIGTGTGQKIAFFNSTPAAQQGSTTDLKDLLVTFGFLVDSGATPLNLDGGALTAGDITSTGTSGLAITGAGGSGQYPVQITTSSAFGGGLTSKVSGDAVNRFLFTVGGLMQWSDGTNTADVQLNRSAAGVLRVSTGDFHVSNVLRHLGSTLGFYNVAAVARPTGYTQTYATASRTHANITASNPPAGGTGATAGAYDTAANRNAMITSLTNVIADVANVKQVLNSVIDDLQANGLLQ